MLGIGFAGLVGAGIARATQDLPVTGLSGAEADAAGGKGGNIPAIAEQLFTKYLLAFEVTSALLITAAVGAMVLAHIEREPGSRRTQKDLSKARFLSDRPGTLPGPGVYARANWWPRGPLPDGSVLTTQSFATGVEPQVIEQMARPNGRPQLGSPDEALGTLDPAPLDGGRS